MTVSALRERAIHPKWPTGAAAATSRTVAGLPSCRCLMTRTKQFRAIQRHMLPQHRQRKWRLLYSSEVHGQSMAACRRTCLAGMAPKPPVQPTAHHNSGRSRTSPKKPSHGKTAAASGSAPETEEAPVIFLLETSVILSSPHTSLYHSGDGWPHDCATPPPPRYAVCLGIYLSRMPHALEKTYYAPGEYFLFTFCTTASAVGQPAQPAESDTNSNGATPVGVVASDLPKPPCKETVVIKDARGKLVSANGTVQTAAVAPDDNVADHAVASSRRDPAVTGGASLNQAARAAGAAPGQQQQFASCGDEDFVTNVEVSEMTLAGNTLSHSRQSSPLILRTTSYLNTVSDDLEESGMPPVNCFYAQRSIAEQSPLSENASMWWASSTTQSVTDTRVSSIGSAADWMETLPSAVGCPTGGGRESVHSTSPTRREAATVSDHYLRTQASVSPSKKRYAATQVSQPPPREYGDRLLMPQAVVQPKSRSWRLLLPSVRRARGEICVRGTEDGSLLLWCGDINKPPALIIAKDLKQVICRTSKEFFFRGLFQDTSNEGMGMQVPKDGDGPPNNPPCTNRQEASGDVRAASAADHSAPVSSPADVIAGDSHFITNRNNEVATGAGASTNVSGTGVSGVLPNQSKLSQEEAGAEFTAPCRSPVRRPSGHSAVCRKKEKYEDFNASVVRVQVCTVGNVPAGLTAATSPLRPLSTSCQ